MMQSVLYSALNGTGEGPLVILPSLFYGRWRLTPAFMFLLTVSGLVVVLTWVAAVSEVVRELLPVGRILVQLDTTPVSPTRYRQLVARSTRTRYHAAWWYMWDSWPLQWAGHFVGMRYFESTYTLTLDSTSDGVTCVFRPLDQIRTIVQAIQIRRARGPVRVFVTGRCSPLLWTMLGHSIELYAAHGLGITYRVIGVDGAPDVDIPAYFHPVHAQTPVLHATSEPGARLLVVSAHAGAVSPYVPGWRSAACVLCPKNGTLSTDPVTLAGVAAAVADAVNTMSTPEPVLLCVDLDGAAGMVLGMGIKSGFLPCVWLFDFDADCGYRLVPPRV
jgi:hypothetical protein